MRMTVASSSERRVATFAAHTGQAHTDPQVFKPPKPALRVPSRFVITPRVTPASGFIVCPHERYRLRLLMRRSWARRCQRRDRPSCDRAIFSATRTGSIGPV